MSHLLLSHQVELALSGETGSSMNVENKQLIFLIRLHYFSLILMEKVEMEFRLHIVPRVHNFKGAKTITICSGLKITKVEPLVLKK